MVNSERNIERAVEEFFANTSSEEILRLWDECARAEYDGTISVGEYMKRTEQQQVRVAESEEGEEIASTAFRRGKIKGAILALSSNVPDAVLSGKKPLYRVELQTAS